MKIEEKARLELERMSDEKLKREMKTYNEWGKRVARSILKKRHPEMQTKRRVNKEGYILGGMFRI